MATLDEAKAAAVVQDDTGWGFTCPYPYGCGDPASTTGFISTGWPSQESAAARLDTHLAEHAEVEAAAREGRAVDLSVVTNLDEFRAEHGIGVNPDGTAFLLNQE